MMDQRRWQMQYTQHTQQRLMKPKMLEIDVELVDFSARVWIQGAMHPMHEAHAPSCENGLFEAQGTLCEKG